MPFKLFQTRPGYYYVYDMNKNSIFKLNETQYRELQSVNNSGNHNPSVLSEFNAKGLLLESQIKKIEHPATKHVEHQLKRCISSITLQMTQDCNLRCAYCPYSENGIYASRSRSSARIGWGTVKAGIDFLVANSMDADKLHIAFYGGEPMLEKDLIVRAMKYAASKISTKPLSFGMTTNGTLLEHDFLSEASIYDFEIIISLDGQQETHDMNRPYPDGKGSFDGILKNVDLLRMNFPKLYDKLPFNTVLNPKRDCAEVYKFFKQNPEGVEYSKIRFNELSENYTDEKFSYDKAYLTEKNFESLKAFLILIGRLDKKSSFEHKEIFEWVYSYKEIFVSQKSAPPISHPNGTCIPGQKKLFIDIHGNFYPCERINEVSPLMNIGNLNEGFDIEKVRKVLNVGTVTENACKDCWAFYCCNMCPISCDNGIDEHYSAEYKLSKCKKVKSSALEMLKNYAMLKEFKFEFDVERIKT